MRTTKLHWVVLVGLVVVAAACSTLNQGVNTLPDRTAARAFTVRADQGIGTFTPSIQVQDEGSGAVVRVYAHDAADLRAAYVHVGYDARSYSPDRVQIGDFLGTPEELVTLAVTDLAGDVPVGMVQVESGGAKPAAGNGLLATVWFRGEPFVGARAASQAPQGPRNQVDDLHIVSQSGLNVTLGWTERNCGDYDNNSMVGLSDLAPIAALYNVSVSGASDPVWAQMVDGDGNGTITMGDIAAIAQNFDNQITGYKLYTDGSTGSVPYGSGMTVNRPDPAPSKKIPVAYQFSLTVSGKPKFSVRPAVGSDIGSPGPVSNVIEPVVDEPGPPNPPTGLTAQAGPTIGVGKIKVAWSKSTSGDVGWYDIQRKETGGGSWADVHQALASASSWTDSGLENKSYDYQVRARDFTALTSDWAGPATATPTMPSPPEGLAVVPSTTQSLAIDISWNKPSDNSATSYRLYRKAPGETVFTVLVDQIPGMGAPPFTQTDTGLTAGDTYHYCVSSVASGCESTQCAEASCAPSLDMPIQIDAVTTDKSTHLQAGTETPANLDVTTTPAVADSYTWSGAGVFSSTSVKNPTWHPVAATKLGKVTLTITVQRGPNNDSKTIDMYVTTQPIQTTLGNGGKFVDFSDVPGMDSINAGGASFAAGRPLSYYTSGSGGVGNVVQFNLFGLW